MYPSTCYMKNNFVCFCFVKMYFSLSLQIVYGRTLQNGTKLAYRLNGEKFTLFLSVCVSQACPQTRCVQRIRVKTSSAQRIILTPVCCWFSALLNFLEWGGKQSWKLWSWSENSLSSVSCAGFFVFTACTALFGVAMSPLGPKVGLNLPFSWVYDHYLHLASASALISLVMAVLLYFYSFRDGAILASGGNTGKMELSWLVVATQVRSVFLAQL